MPRKHPHLDKRWPRSFVRFRISRKTEQMLVPQLRRPIKEIRATYAAFRARSPATSVPLTAIFCSSSHAICDTGAHNKAHHPHSLQRVSHSPVPLIHQVLSASLSFTYLGLMLISLPFIKLSCMFWMSQEQSLMVVCQGDVMLFAGENRGYKDSWWCNSSLILLEQALLKGRDDLGMNPIMFWNIALVLVPTRQPSRFSSVHSTRVRLYIIKIISAF